MNSRYDKNQNNDDDDNIGKWEQTQLRTKINFFFEIKNIQYLIHTRIFNTKSESEISLKL